MSTPRFNSYEQAWDFLLSAVDYEKLVAYKYDVDTFDLGRVRAFMAALGDPHRAFKTVHVAGTKGKGSTSTMVAAILREAGYRTGLFTSPHMIDLEERIVVDGRKITKDDTISLVSAIANYVERERERDLDLSPTFFEMLAAMGFLHFRRARVDFGVIEVGLGGRLDATNVVAPEACAITTIGFDHVDKLGDTLAAIAGEKAGIVKPGAPVVTGVHQPEALDTIKARCAEQGAPLYELGKHVRVEGCRVCREAGIGTTAVLRSWRHEPFEVTLPLLGMHQARNAAVALGIVAALEERGALPPVGTDTIAEALGKVALPGRAQVVASNPTIIVDGAHTVESIHALREAIDAYVPHERLILVLGVATDKDVDGIIREIVPHADEAIFSTSDSPRAAEAAALAARAKALCGREGRVIESPAHAIAAAQGMAAPGDLICVTGSFYLAGDVLEALRGDG